MFKTARSAKCPNCGYSLKSGQYDCPACGTNVREKPEPRPNVNVRKTNIQVVNNSKGRKEIGMMKTTVAVIVLIVFLFGGLRLMDNNIEKRNTEEKEKFYSEVNTLVDQIQKDVSNKDFANAEVLLVRLKNLSSSWTTKYNVYRDEMYELMLKRYEEAQTQD